MDWTRDLKLVSKEAESWSCPEITFCPILSKNTDIIKNSILRVTMSGIFERTHWD